MRPPTWVLVLVVLWIAFGVVPILIVTLVRLKPGWRIADIDWGGQAGKLSDLFAHAK